MLRHAVHEFEEVGFITPLVEHMWDTSAWLPDEEGLGGVLSALVGYTASPSLTQVIAYVAYFVAVLAALMRPWREEARGEASLPRAAGAPS
jgi:high-affinity iron transporter